MYARLSQRKRPSRSITYAGAARSSMTPERSKVAGSGGFFKALPCCEVPYRPPRRGRPVGKDPDSAVSRRRISADDGGGKVWAYLDCLSPGVELFTPSPRMS